MSLASPLDPTLKELGRRFNLVSFLPSIALAVFLGLLVRTGAFSGPPNARRLLPSEILVVTGSSGQRTLTLGELAYITLTVLLVSLILYPFQLQVVRIFEGYWGNSRAAAVLSAIGVERHRRQRQLLQLADARETPAFSAAPPIPKPSDEQRREWQQRLNEVQSQAATMLDQYPEERRLLPTRIGNILRSAEDRAGQRYGLDTVTIWPRLFPYIQGPLAAALVETQDQFDMYLRLCITFGLATLLSTIVLLDDGWWLVVPAMAGLLTWICYQAATRAAANYAEATVVAFDLHRFDMLRGLHYPLPENLEEEQAFNDKLVGFLVDNEPLNGEERTHAYQHSDTPSSKQNFWRRLLCRR
jgi:hypothetical protein